MAQPSGAAAFSYPHHHGARLRGSFRCPDTARAERGLLRPDIEQAEARLGVAIPASLAACLQASNGFTDLAGRYSYGWDLATIVAENLRAWSDGATPLARTLLGFGGDGAGGWFCVPTDARGGVFHWNWIDATAHQVADDVAPFWRSWLTGSLRV